MSQVKKLIEIALGEVGYLEKKSNAQLEDKTANAGLNNYTKYGAWWANGALQAQPWCAIFISYCANQAGIPEDIFYPHAYCPYGVSWYKARGLWHPRSGYTPKAGDIIYFTTNGTSAAHVGLVYDCDGVRVYSVEGNTSGGSTVIANGGGVARKSYALTYTGILGYATPKYIEEGDKPAPEEEEMIRYETYDDVPPWGQLTVKKMLARGYMTGRNDRGTPAKRDDLIDLSDDMLRSAVFNDRAGVYGGELTAEEVLVFEVGE